MCLLDWEHSSFMAHFCPWHACAPYPRTVWYLLGGPQIIWNHCATSIFSFLFSFFAGIGVQCSGFTPGSVLWNDPCSSQWGHIWCRGLNLNRLCARQVPTCCNIALVLWLAYVFEKFYEVEYSQQEEVFIRWIIFWFLSFQHVAPAGVWICLIILVLLILSWKCYYSLEEYLHLKTTSR